MGVGLKIKLVCYNWIYLLISSVLSLYNDF